MILRSLQKLTVLMAASLFLTTNAFAGSPKATAAADAEPTHRSGFYVGVQGGLNMFNNNKTTGPLGFFDYKVGYDKGFTFGGFAGYDFGKFFRAELELTYKQAEIDSLKTSFLGLPINLPIQGKVKNLNVMANAYFEYPVNSLITPYVGVGLGMAQIRGTGLTLNLPIIGQKRNVQDTVFAYQLIAGVGFNVTDHVTIGMDYRFVDTLKGRFELKDVFFGFDAPFKMKLSSHNFMVNVRYNF